MATVPPGNFLAQAAAVVADLFTEIDDATARFAAASGIGCRAGCGACCFKPGIEARVIELLPAALALTAEGAAEAAYDRAAADPDGACVFLVPHPDGGKRGRCSSYATRPGVCRLFGFAAARGKDGRRALASCLPHKEDHAEQIARVNERLAAPATGGGAEDDVDGVPCFSDYGMRLAGIAGHSAALGERLPLNRALMRALEKASLLGGRSQHET